MMRWFITLFTFIALLHLDELVAMKVKLTSNIRKSIASSVIGVMIPFGCTTFPSHADVDINCVKNVLRVQTSLQYIEGDIEQLGDMSKVIANIKSLVNNYKLDDNIKKSIELASKSQKDNARTHGRAAIEDLAQIYEYFSDQIDDFSGKPKTTREILTFALQATKAAENELTELVNALPSDISITARDEVKQEFQGSSS